MVDINKNEIQNILVIDAYAEIHKADESLGKQRTSSIAMNQKISPQQIHKHVII